MSPDVVVAGGGVIGLAVALRSVELGAAVTLVDPAPGSGASWAAAGMLAPVTEVHPGEEDLLRLNVASAAMYGSWISHVEDKGGTSCAYRRSGTLVVARDADENAELDELFSLQLSLGLDATRLRSSECRALEPGLSPRVRGGIFVDGDHSIDNRLLVEALLTACDRSGVRFVADTVVAVEGEDAVSGVALASGERLPCDAVVIACGARSSELRLPEAEHLPPIRPVKGQLIHLRARSMSSLPTRTLRGPTVYAVPRADGRLIVGATMEERGHDTAVTAGGVYELLRDVYEIFPEVAEFELVETTAGSRPATPDNAPLLGPGRVDGLVYATGHFRNGVLLAPLTGEHVARAAVEGAVDEVIAPFAPTRFEDPARLAS